MNFNNKVNEYVYKVSNIQGGIMKATKIVVVLLVVVTLALTGCAGGRGTPQAPAQIAPSNQFVQIVRPDWYEAAEEDANNYFFYAEAERASRSGAIAAAVEDNLAQISLALGAVVLRHGQRLIDDNGLGEDAVVAGGVRVFSESIARNMVRNARAMPTDAYQIGDRHFIGFARFNFSKRAIFTQIAESIENDPN